MLNNEQAVSGETQGQERSTIVSRPGYVCVNSVIKYDTWLSHLIFPRCTFVAFFISPISHVSHMWHEALKHGKALVKGCKLSWRKVCRQNLCFECLVVELCASRLLRHTHFSQYANDCVNIERNTSFFWFDGHKIQDAFCVEIIAVDLEWFYAHIQVLIRFLSLLLMLWPCSRYRTGLTWIVHMLVGAHTTLT